MISHVSFPYATIRAPLIGLLFISCANPADIQYTNTSAAVDALSPVNHNFIVYTDSFNYAKEYSIADIAREKNNNLKSAEIVFANMLSDFNTGKFEEALKYFDDNSKSTFIRFYKSKYTDIVKERDGAVVKLQSGFNVNDYRVISYEISKGDKKFNWFECLRIDKNGDWHVTYDINWQSISFEFATIKYSSMQKRPPPVVSMNDLNGYKFYAVSPSDAVPTTLINKTDIAKEIDRKSILVGVKLDSNRYDLLNYRGDNKNLQFLSKAIHEIREGTIPTGDLISKYWQTTDGMNSVKNPFNWFDSSQNAGLTQCYALMDGERMSIAFLGNINEVQKPCIVLEGENGLKIINKFSDLPAFGSSFDEIFETSVLKIVSSNASKEKRIRKGLSFSAKDKSTLCIIYIFISLYYLASYCHLAIQ